MNNYLVEALQKQTVITITSDEQQELAHQLAKNNVVCMPVGVGDKLWYIRGGYYNSPNQRPVSITVAEISQKLIKDKPVWGFIATNNTRYSFSSIGKTVFYTYDEAAAVVQQRLEKINDSKRKIT